MRRSEYLRSLAVLIVLILAAGPMLGGCRPRTQVVGGSSSGEGPRMELPLWVSIRTTHGREVLQALEIVELSGQSFVAYVIDGEAYLLSLKDGPATPLGETFCLPEGQIVLLAESPVPGTLLMGMQSDKSVPDVHWKHDFMDLYLISEGPPARLVYGAQRNRVKCAAGLIYIAEHWSGRVLSFSPEDTTLKDLFAQPKKATPLATIAPSPDGRFVAYTSGPSDGSGIQLYDQETGEHSPVLPNLCAVWSLDWYDSDRLICLVYEWCRSRLYTVEIRGGLWAGFMHEQFDVLRAEAVRIVDDGLMYINETEIAEVSLDLDALFRAPRHMQANLSGAASRADAYGHKGSPDMIRGSYFSGDHPQFGPLRVCRYMSGAGEIALLDLPRAQLSVVGAYEVGADHLLLVVAHPRSGQGYRFDGYLYDSGTRRMRPLSWDGGRPVGLSVSQDSEGSILVTGAGPGGEQTSVQRWAYKAGRMVRVEP